ncbi:MAG TPA: vanadium-dependent haloperoxidase, partial [Vicinamibacteria bacterium]|nr:vanadium-dependent haloperoxidase [Vicinamibacteria bacterium]
NPNGTVQRFLAPHWGRATPFALGEGSQFRPPDPPLLPNGTYRRDANHVLHLSAALGDREKVIATYWADGPSTETPPGHWNLFAQFVSARDGHGLDADVKMFFALGNAMLDSSIAVWDCKRHFDLARPITAIRYLYAGKPVRAWAGPFLGTQVIDGASFRPYIATPPFAEYVSGHSTFSAAGAEILAAFSGSDTFGGSVTIPAGASPVEPGAVPAEDVTLSWATFSEAADEAGISRRYGGIHFETGDLSARELGRLMGALVWQTARTYIDGTAH